MRTAGILASLFLTLAGSSLLRSAAPLKLHPQNPHYFLFRDNVTVLVTSGEHYGAVLNLDFNYAEYLKTLQKDHLNLTRTFTGVYREVPGNFDIASNTLAPKPDRFLCPWPRSPEPGALDGGNKFDLSKWDETYFKRLKDFVSQAGKRGVVVEMNLFCPFYEDAMWNVSPLNAKNNINKIGDLPRTGVYTMKDTRLQDVQDAMVRRIVTELRDFDNLYYEICNEPYFGGVTLDWQAHISEVIEQAEAPFPAHHLISQNIANGSTLIQNPDARVAIFNFHYSRPPQSVELNFDLKKPIGNNETGFDGNADSTYRIQGWDFIAAGGALYNSLDYSFTVGNEKGTFKPPETTPGGGSPNLRRQLGYLLDAMKDINLLRMAPDSGVVKSGVPEGATARSLSEPRKQYFIYVHHGRSVEEGKPRYVVDTDPHQMELTVVISPGSYRAQWLSPKTGKVDKSETFEHRGGDKVLASPTYTEDVVLRIVQSLR